MDCFEGRITKLLLRIAWEMLGIEWKENTQAREPERLVTFTYPLYLLQPPLLLCPHTQRITQIFSSNLFLPCHHLIVTLPTADIP